MVQPPAAAPAGWSARAGGYVRPMRNGGVARLRLTGRDDGDLALGSDPATLAANRQRVQPGSWTWLRQVHGSEVVVVRRAGDGAGTAADAAVSAAPGAVLAVHSADCAVVGFWSPDGVIGAAHAGWRGLRAGVLQRTVEAMRALGATSIQALTGPCIEAACYEFGAEDLATVARTLGPTVAGRTRNGRPALDLRAGIRVALAQAAASSDGLAGPTGVTAPITAGVTAGIEISIDESQWCCTACSPVHFSHRARRDTGRSALVIALEAPAVPAPAGQPAVGRPVTGDSA